MPKQAATPEAPLPGQLPIPETGAEEMTPSKWKTMFSSDSPDWRTPEVVLDLVRCYANRTTDYSEIILDPAGHPATRIARYVLCPPDHDGLKEDWLYWAGGGGLVFVNPPYGRALAPWMAKMREEALKEVHILALVSARLDTRWWHDNVIPRETTAIAFWKGRIRFLGPDGRPGDAAPFPSALILWGGNSTVFRDVFRQHAQVWRERL